MTHFGEFLKDGQYNPFILQRNKTIEYHLTKSMLRTTGEDSAVQEVMDAGGNR